MQYSPRCAPSMSRTSSECWVLPETRTRRRMQSRFSRSRPVSHGPNGPLRSGVNATSLTISARVRNWINRPQVLRGSRCWMHRVSARSRNSSFARLMRFRTSRSCFVRLPLSVGVLISRTIISSVLRTCFPRRSTMKGSTSTDVRSTGNISNRSAGSVRSPL